jgi:hypothetical protein
VSEASARRSHMRLARWLTEALAPIYQIFALLFVVGVNSAGLGDGLRLGLIAAIFAGGIPYSILLAGVHRGRLTDRHLSSRAQRPSMMAIGLLSVTVGLMVMIRLNAPHQLYALVVAMAVGVAVALTISTFWKISIHAACTAGSIAVLTVALGPRALLLTPLLAAVCWARVTLKDHSRLQVVAGAAVGAAVGGAVMSILL